jgi:hypothetical protein
MVAWLLAALLFCSGSFLLYTAIIAPVQIFVWEFDDEKCNVFPTLYFDMCVDIFFLVRLPLLAFIIELGRDLIVPWLMVSWSATVLGTRED